MKRALLALLLAACATPAFAQEKTFELKISHWVPASHPLQKALEDWGAAVEKASGGTIKSRVYPAQQLGKAFDHYDMARDGIADFTYVNPGYQPGRFPIIGAGELPFLMSDAKGGSMGLDAWYRKYAATEMKDVKYCLAFIHAPSSFHSRTKKIVVPDDIKGMKIRPADATIANFVTLLGGTNVQSSAPEVRDIIERGVADAVTFPCLRRCYPLHLGAPADLELMRGPVALQVVDHGVPGRPATRLTGNREARQPGKAAHGVQVQPVVARAPAGPHLITAFQDHRVHPPAA